MLDFDPFGLILLHLIHLARCHATCTERLHWFNQDSNHSGLYGDFTLREYDSAFRLILTDLLVRTFLIAVGIYATIQNMVFFLRRPQETTLLLLALFSGVSLSRAAFSSGYVDYFIAQPYWSIFFYKPPDDGGGVAAATATLRHVATSSGLGR